MQSLGKAIAPYRRAQAKTIQSGSVLSIAHKGKEEQVLLVDPTGLLVKASIKMHSLVGLKIGAALLKFADSQSLNKMAATAILEQLFSQQNHPAPYLYKSLVLVNLLVEDLPMVPA